jgi:outer membrane receptor for ferrienterochelin and colicin
MMRFFLMLFILCLSHFATYAGKITGRVLDEKNSEAIIGATVVVKGTANGAVTDVDGNFAVIALPGTYTLEVKYLGYQTKEVQDIHVTDAIPVTLTILISEATSTQLQEVVVRSSLKKETINALYAIQKNAAAISDGISADVIRRSPDRNTGEVLKRVSGTTIQDNKFVIIRGLGDRYNSAMVDNSILPSTEPNKKAFSFNIMPATMIDNIVVTKAATPDLPGDFAGGVINILTKEVPDRNFNSISAGLSFNSVSTGSAFRSGYRSKTDFLGFDDGSRQLPSRFPSSGKIYGGLTRQENVAALNSLNNDYTIKTHNALPGINLQGTIGKVYKTGGNNRFGFTGALTYSHNENIKRDLLRQYDGFNYRDNVYNYSTSLGALLNAGYYFGANKIVFKTIYNRVLDDNFLYRTGYNNSSSSDVRYYAFDLIQKSLFKTSLEGDHQIGNRQSKINWLLSYNSIANNQPDQRKVSYSNSGSGFYADNTTLGKYNNRLFGDLNESIFNAAVNYSIPFSLFSNKSALKVGALEQFRYRDFSNRYLGAVLQSNMAPEEQEDARTRPIESLYARGLIQNNVYRLEEITIPGDQYTATTTTTAAYAMLDNRFSEKVRLVWGARFESYTLDIKAGDGTHVQPVWNDLLPSANLTYRLNKTSNIRASYFRSVARPEMREVAPLAYYDYELNATFQGTPSLMRTTIDNIDLRYEVFSGHGEILSASVFYKKFRNTIESNVNGQNSGYEINPANYPSATNLGAEIEVRKRLDFIANNALFENLNLYANLAYIHSQVALGGPSYANGHEYTTRSLAGQSPFVINTSLGYETPDGKLNLNVLYNRIGDRIFLVGQGRFGNVIESSRNLLDFQASYKLSKRSEVRFNIKDILNNPVRFYFDQDNNGSFAKQDISNGIDDKQDWIYSEYRPGSTMSLTYTLKFE